MATTDQASLFSPRKYYRIGNINLPGAFLSANPITTTGGTVSLSLNGSLSSENWQLFAQSGRYFIRNYDFGSSLQLGLSAPSQDIPRMSMSQGLIQQQWSITGTTGGYYLANGLWGNDITLAIGTQLDVNMRPNASANIWSITENASAANSKQPIQDGVSSFEVRPPSSFVLRTSSTGIGFQVATPESPPTASPPPKPSKVSKAAIAGIAVGASVMLAVFIVGVWLLLMRRRRTAQADKSNELHNEQKATVEMETDANRAEMETKDNYPELQSPVAELGSKGDLVELPGSDPREGHPPMELGVATRRHSSA